MVQLSNSPTVPVTLTRKLSSSSARLARLDAARWLAALAVVLLHCAAQAVSDVGAYGSKDWFTANLYDSAARWCVPVFVMVSGVLLLDTKKQVSTQEFYLRRAARICAPLIFWTIFYLAWRTWLDWWDDGRIDLSFWTSEVAHGTPYYHLWYLYMIVGLYLFTPLIRFLYQRSQPTTRKFCLIGILGIAILDALYRQTHAMGHGFFLTWFIPYVGYFIAGRMIFDGELRIPRPALVLVLSVAATALGVLALSTPNELNFYFYDYFSVTVLFMSLAAFQWIMESSRIPLLSMLAPLTFGIYLIHPLFLDLAARLDTLPTWATAWSVPTQAIVVFGLSAGCCWLLRQHPTTRKLV